MGKTTQTYTDIPSLRNRLNQEKSKKCTIGVVPTMGALHIGHEKLILQSLQKCDVTVVTIFVNPVQFNDPKDYEKYPVRTPEDTVFLENLGVDIVFIPTNQSIYRNQPSIQFNLGTIEKNMEGGFREGHFSGVCLIICKLFNIIHPDFAFFGEKDFQQLRVIESLVDQLSYPIEIVRVPTVREESGLAFSSRNRRIVKELYSKSTLFYKCLLKSKEEILKGRPIIQVKDEVLHTVEATEGVTLEYFEIAEEQDLQPVESINKVGNYRLFIAGKVGDVRLIDNIEL